MDLEEAFKLAQEGTRFIRERKNLLYTFGSTRLPYVCLSESGSEREEVMVRIGEVVADKPKIALPGEYFSFEGFDGMPGEWAEDHQVVSLARRISMPPSKYVNKAEAPGREAGTLADAIQRTVNRLEDANDVRTAVIAAPESIWPLSILLYVGSQVARSAQSNVQEHFEHLRLRG